MRTAMQSVAALSSRGSSAHTPRRVMCGISISIWNAAMAPMSRSERCLSARLRQVESQSVLRLCTRNGRSGRVVTATLRVLSVSRRSRSSGGKRRLVKTTSKRWFVASRESELHWAALHIRLIKECLFPVQVRQSRHRFHASNASPLTTQNALSCSSDT